MGAFKLWIWIVFFRLFRYQYNSEQAATISQTCFCSHLSVYCVKAVTVQILGQWDVATLTISENWMLMHLWMLWLGIFYQPGCWQVGPFYDSHAQQWSTYYRSWCGGSVCVCPRCGRTRWGIKALLCTVCFQDGWAEAIFVMARWLSHEFSTRYPSPVSLTSCFSKGSFITCVNFTYR